MDNKLLELLYCPVSQTRLEYDLENQVLISKTAKLVFPIRDGIPVMLESEATPLDVWEKNKRNDVKEHFANVAQEKKVAKEVAAAEALAPQKAVVKKTVAKKTADKKEAAPKKVASKKTATKKATVKKSSPQEESN